MIKVRNLNFSYGKNPFIENMNFEVKKGEIFGFLGPSGAGKSTLQKIMTGLIESYSGSVTINEMECKLHKKNFYENIGVDFEYSSLYEKLTAIENLNFFASLYKKKPPSIDKLLETVSLQNDKNKKVFEYSKGMKSRLNFIRAIMHDPEVIFLDEPTSGLDPTNAKIMKDIIISEKNREKTVILTTHNMIDASEICDRVAFIVNGKICALDTPHNLIMLKGAMKVRYSYIDNKDHREYFRECELKKISEDKLFNKLIKTDSILTIHTSEPTLNDIFIEITGKNLV